MRRTDGGTEGANAGTGTERAAPRGGAGRAGRGPRAGAVLACLALTVGGQSLAQPQPPPRPAQAAPAGRPLPVPPPQPTPPAATPAQAAPGAPAPAAPLVPAPAPVAGGAPPHEWLYGSWTGGLFPAADDEGPRCLGQPTLVVTRDLVMRVASLDVAYRQRPIETVSLTPNGLEVRLVPIGAPGARLPPDIGFGCSSPDLLRVERRGPNEIVLPNCADFPAPLKRCLAR